MGRPPRQDGKISVTLHVDKGHRYASSQPFTIDPKTGRKKYSRVHWGYVTDDLRFLPNFKFENSPHVWDTLEFHPEWDISKVDELRERYKVVSTKVGRPAYDGTDVNRHYGDIWLLERISEKIGLRRDLEIVFDGDKERVDDIVTLAIFPLITGYNFNRLQRWQRIAKSPSKRVLSPSAITQLTKDITEQHRMDIFRKRIARLDHNDVLAVDSTSKSCYGGALTDIRWGKNKEGVRLPQTNEAVVYSLKTHMPVYYRMFAGNVPDSRTLGMIYTDLEHAGFADLNIPMVTDRGYEKIETLETHIAKGRALVMCTKTSQKLVSSVIDSLGILETGLRPDCMTIDTEEQLYYYQCDLRYNLLSIHGTVKPAKNLKLNLFFDPVRRSQETMRVDTEIELQRMELEQAYREALVIPDADAFCAEFTYFDVVVGEKTHVVSSFSLNQKRKLKATRLSGYIAIISHNVAGGAQEMWRMYKLRDEQEKYFTQMKTLLVNNRNRTWNEESNEGRKFILFVSLVLTSYIRYVWKSTGLCDKLSTIWDILDEMRSIRCIEHNHKAKFITPFVGKQLDICESFGFEVPKGCAPGYKSKKYVEKKKRGRPSKKNLTPPQSY